MEISTENDLVLPLLQSNLDDSHRELLLKIESHKTLIASKAIDLQIAPENMRKALSFAHKLACEKGKLSIENVKTINTLIGEEGKLREFAPTCFDKSNVGVRGPSFTYSGADGEHVEKLLSSYAEQYTPVEETSKPLEKICGAYLLLELIHPFFDGNGRTGRTICAFLMFSYGYGSLAPHLIACWEKEKEKHYEDFISGIYNYYAYSYDLPSLNEFFSKFYLKFLKRIAAVLDGFVGDNP